MKYGNDHALQVRALTTGAIKTLATWGNYAAEYSIDFSDNIQLDGTVIHTSDERIKTDIIDSTKPSLDIINKIILKEYNYKYRKNTDVKQVGVIAQQIKQDIDDVYGTDIVRTHDEQSSLRISNNEYTDLLSIKKESMYIHLIGAVQELTKENNQLKDQIALLWNEINDLKAT